MDLVEIVKLIKSANTIALFSHINPDCDTLGSALALRLFLTKQGKEVSAYCDGERKFDLSDLYTAEVIDRDPPKRSYDLTIAVDCATKDRLGKYGSLFDKGRKTLCIDHHLQD
ncbi:MAG: DHH family phosphoesterase, partial [Clostridia bacterium]|nr:DHH family phosphoesterase [Clostridia bacterium]